MTNSISPKQPKGANILFTFETPSPRASAGLWEDIVNEFGVNVHLSHLSQGEGYVQCRVEGKPRPWSDHCARRYAEAIGASVYFEDPTDPELLPLLESIASEDPGVPPITAETDAVVVSEGDVIRLAVAPRVEEERANTDSTRDANDVLILYETGPDGEGWSVDTQNLRSVDTVYYTAKEKILAWKQWLRLLIMTRKYWSHVSVDLLDDEDSTITNLSVETT